MSLTEEQTRLVISIVVIAAFTAMMVVTLMGLVDVSNPEIAKLVGAIFGYLTGILTMVFTRYFKVA